MVADRGAAAGHQQVAAARRARGLAQRVGAVAGDPQDHRLAAHGGDHGGEGVAIGTDDLLAAGRLAGADDFIAGGQDRHPRLAAHRQPRVIEGGGQANIAGGQQATGRQDGVAGAEIEAGRADVAAGGRAFAHRHLVAVDGGVFLDDDGIGAGGHRRAGENPHTDRRRPCRRRRRRPGPRRFG